MPGGSTLITSAPMSPSIIVQNGPARMRLRAITRKPSSAPAAGSLIGASSFAHGGRRVEVLFAACAVLLQRALVAHAEFLEVRLAAFEEGVHALEALLRAPHVGEQLHAVLPRG